MTVIKFQQDKIAHSKRTNNNTTRNTYARFFYIQHLNGIRKKRHQTKFIYNKNYFLFFGENNKIHWKVQLFHAKTKTREKNEYKEHTLLFSVYLT